jgi:beta-phosphoglucomutase
MAVGQLSIQVPKRPGTGTRRQFGRWAERMIAATRIREFERISIGCQDGIRAAIFDFNGTITDDEELQYQVYADTFAEELGVEFGRDDYFMRLAGRPDTDILLAAFSRSGIAWSSELAEQVSRARIGRYLDRIRSAPPVRPGTAALIQTLWQRVPMAVVTGAPRDEAVPVLDASNLSDKFETIVTIEDVIYGKPHPEGFLTAFQRLIPEIPDLDPSEIVVFEDSLAGIIAARAAGMRCIAAHLSPGSTSQAANQIVDTLDEGILSAAVLT